MKNLVLALLMLMLFPALAYADGQVDRTYDASDLFYGDKRSACEAILCLSSPTRPTECRDAIRKYYSIKRFTHGSFSFSKTLKARKNFLQLCPSGGDVSIDHLVSSISNTMNQCDADSLNRRRIYHFRSYSVLGGGWSAWQLLGRNNDDYGSRKTDKPETNTKYSFNARSFPVCSQRQLDYKENLAAGREKPQRARDEDGNWVTVHPVQLTCYETRNEIDPNAPSDCQELFNSDYSYYDNLKYVGGKWVQQ